MFLIHRLLPERRPALPQAAPLRRGRRWGQWQGWYPDQRLLAVSRLADQVNEAKWELHFFDVPTGVIVKAINLATLADKPHALSVRGQKETLFVHSARVRRRLWGVDAIEFFERICVPQYDVAFRHGEQP